MLITEPSTECDRSVSNVMPPAMLPNMLFIPTMPNHANTG